jgi:hypothetical protein
MMVTSEWRQRGKSMILKGTAMTIDLKPEQQRVIDLAARSGAYQDPSEVLDQGV